MNETITEGIASRTTRSRMGNDRLIFGLLLLHLPFVALLAPLGYGTMTFAVTSALGLGAVSVLGYLTLRGTRGFGAVAGAVLMGFSAVLIQAQMGRLEMHFHIFAALAVLLIYRDWLPVVVAAAVIAVHHLLLTALQLSGATLGDMPLVVFNYGCSWGIAGLHAFFVVLESALLVVYARIMHAEQQAAFGLMAAVSQVRTSRDLTVRLPDNTASEIAAAFNETMTLFARLADDARQAGGDIQSAATHLAESISSTRDMMETQRRETSEAATAVTEMSQTAHESARNTAGVAEAVQEADREADAGDRTVSAAVDQVRGLEQVMGEAAAAIEELQRSAGNIGSVTDVIRGISEQTNLLALNAAIEAARAGESGRGFAVVADEVRKLAQQTSQSIDEIQRITDGVREHTQSAVRLIEDGTARTGATSEAVQGAGGALAQVREAVARIRGMADQLATAAEEQSTVAEEVSRNINTINDHGVRLAEQSEGDVRIVNRMKELASGLDRATADYRL